MNKTTKKLDSLILKSKLIRIGANILGWLLLIFYIYSAYSKVYEYTYVVFFYISFFLIGYNASNNQRFYTLYKEDKIKEKT